MGGQAGLGLLPVGTHGFCRTAPVIAVTHPAAWLYYRGGSQIAQVDQGTRREAVEVAGTIRFIGEQAGEGQLYRAYLDPSSGLDAQGLGETCLGPELTRLRQAAGLFFSKAAGGGFQLASQRVGRRHGLDTGQLQALVAGQHAGKLDALSMLEAERNALVDLRGVDRLAAAQYQIGGEKLAGAQHHGFLQTVAEEADTAAGADGNQQ